MPSHAKRKYHVQQRPNNFLLDHSHPLAKGLMFAGLGNVASGIECQDSSLYRKHGTLTTMEPETDWVWASALNRFALDFGGTDELVVASPQALITAHPVTLACWANIPTDTGAVMVLMGAMAGSTSHGWSLHARLATANNPVGAATKASSTLVDTAGSITMGEWFHCAGTFESVTNREAWFNGVRSGSPDTTSVTPAGVNGFYLGAFVSSSYLTGQLCDAMIWNRILSDYEIKSLADPSNVMLSGAAREKLISAGAVESK